MCTGVGAFFTSSKSKWSVLMNAERWWDKRLFDVSAPLLVWVHFFFQFLSRLLLLGRQLSSQFVYFFFLLLCEVWKMNASAWSYRILHWLSCYQFWFKCVYDSFTIHNFFRWQSAHTFFHFAIFGFHHFDLPVCKNRFVCCSKRVVCVCVYNVFLLFLLRNQLWHSMANLSTKNIFTQVASQVMICLKTGWHPLNGISCDFYQF